MAHHYLFNSKIPKVHTNTSFVRFYTLTPKVVKIQFEVPESLKPSPIYVIRLEYPFESKFDQRKHF